MFFFLGFLYGPREKWPVLHVNSDSESPKCVLTASLASRSRLPAMVSRNSVSPPPIAHSSPDFPNPWEQNDSFASSPSPSNALPVVTAK